MMEVVTHKERITMSATDTTKRSIHPSGLGITFDEKGHKYYDDNGQIYRSVTKIIHALFPKFEKDQIAAAVARKRGVSKWEVIKEWDDNCTVACDLGTMVHRYAECMIENIPFDMRPTTQKQADFIKVVHNFIPKLLSKFELVECEKIVFAPDLGLSGMVDLIMKNKTTGNLCIFDWKTNKELKLTDQYGKCGLYPFVSHLSNCNFSHYALQINTYRYLLNREGYDDYSNAEMALFHINDIEVKGYPLPDMTDTVEELCKFVKENHGDIW